MLQVETAFTGMTKIESTQLCINAINAGAKISITIKCRDSSNNEITVQGDDLLKDAFEAYSVFNPGENLHYGSVNATEVKIRFVKNSKTDQIDWSKKIEVYFNVPTSAGTGTVLYGEYYGDVPNKVTQYGSSVYEYIGYDIIGTLDTPADSFINTLTFPITCENLLTQLSTYLGVGIVFMDYNYQPYKLISIGKNAFNNCTLREVLSLLAEAHSQSVIVQGNTIYLKHLSTIPANNPIIYTITPDQYYSITKSEQIIPPYPYTVSFESTYNPVRNASVNSSLSSNNILYKIQDNGVIDYQLNYTVQAVLTKIMENFEYEDTGVLRTGYYPTSVNAFGNPFIQAGDTIWVEDLQGVTDFMHVFTNKFTYGAKTRSYYECTGSVNPQEENNTIITTKQVNRILGNRIVDNLTTAGKGMVLDASQGKVLDESMVHKTGTEAITGAKEWRNNMVIENSVNNPYIQFRANPDAGLLSTYNARVRAVNSATGDGNFGNVQFYFDEFSPNSSGGRTNYSEKYRLPAVATGLAEDKTYEILTSKTIYVSSYTINSSATGGTAYVDYSGSEIVCHKYGRVAMINAKVKFAKAKSDYDYLFTVPTAYRPIRTIWGTFHTGNADCTVVRASVTTDGKVYTQGAQTKSTTYYAQFIYITNA